MEAELVRLSRRILDAVDATLLEVSLLAIDTSFRRFLLSILLRDRGVKGKYTIYSILL
nr:MAG TPA: hypothetical protein [Caudoviricetes sp.]